MTKKDEEGLKMQQKHRGKGCCQAFYFPIKKRGVIYEFISHQSILNETTENMLKISDS